LLDPRIDRGAQQIGDQIDRDDAVIAEVFAVVPRGAIVARELFGTTIPVIVTAGSDLRTDDLATVRADETGVELRG